MVKGGETTFESTEMQCLLLDDCVGAWNYMFSVLWGMSIRSIVPGLGWVVALYQRLVFQTERVGNRLGFWRGRAVIRLLPTTEYLPSAETAEP